jgi:hypothetical protein
MRRCLQPFGLFVSPPVLLLMLGCAGGLPQLEQTNPVMVGAQPGAARLQADTKPFTDLRIPKISGTEVVTQDRQVVQAAATSTDSSGPELKPQQTQPDRPEDPLAKLRNLQQTAAQYYANVDSYIVRLRRREQVNGKDKPEEVMLLKFRKRPFSVYLKWLGSESNGREVVYVRGEHEDKIHTLLAAGDMPLMPAGKRIALAPDSILVRSASRRSIYDTGFGTVINRLGVAIEALEKGDRRVGTVRYLGLMKRPEFETPCEAIEQIIPPGVEPLLARGGKRLTLFDSTTKFPTLLSTQDETGHEVEYYCFDRLQYPVRLDDQDFDPDKLWPSGKPQSVQENKTPIRGDSPPSRPR